MKLRTSTSDLTDRIDGLSLTDDVRARRASGQHWPEIAQATGLSVPTLWRWLKRRERFDAGDGSALGRGKSSGRPPVCRWSAEDVQAIRETYIKTNLADERGSMSHAVRRLVFEDRTAPAAGCRRLSAEALTVLGRRMNSKHYIPRSLRRQLEISPSTFRYHRNPREAALAGPYVPGGTRLASGGSRRLWAGERKSYDDGSQNQVIWYPWPYGGDRCSDKFGVRCGRGQWLVAHDDATGRITSWTFTLRPRDSYRDPDAMGLVYRDARDTGRPDEAVLEGGAWQSRRALAFHQAAGIRIIDAKGRPHMKLIENWWNRAWTHLSVYDRGQIGRFRGEYQRENELLVSCRSGAEDPRKHFAGLQELLREFESCVSFLDHDPLESRQYGTWIPVERWDADVAAHPRPSLSPDLAPFAAPESHVVTIRRGGMVVCNVTCPLGIPTPYTFAHEELMPFEGEKVRVLFDPFEPIIRAAIILDRDSALAKGGDLLCTVGCMNPPPLPIAAEGWAIERDSAGLAEALSAKKAIAKAVRTEYRAAGSGGRRGVAMSETRGPGGVERIEFEGGAAGSLPAAVATGRGASPRPAPEFQREGREERETPRLGGRGGLRAGAPLPAARRLKTFAELAEA